MAEAVAEETRATRPGTLEHYGRAVSERLTMLRKRGAYGRTLRKSTIQRIAERSQIPVDVLHYDPVEDKTTIQTIQDERPLVEENKRMFRDASGRWQEFTLVARLPEAMVAKLYHAGINIYRRDDFAKVLAKLDSSEWSHFRTRPGRLSKRPAREYYPMKGQYNTRRVFRSGDYGG